MGSAIEDYAIIGDGRTAALVSRDGSIDWLCLPRFDSDACFAALLGKPENGLWKICPGATVASHRRYESDTMVLHTEFAVGACRARLVDFMAVCSAGPL
jgi:GH15 family glucan-1,4-alpha-glucosidase